MPSIGYTLTRFLSSFPNPETTIYKQRDISTGCSRHCGRGKPEGQKQKDRQSHPFSSSLSCWMASGSFRAQRKLVSSVHPGDKTGCFPLHRLHTNTLSLPPHLHPLFYRATSMQACRAKRATSYRGAVEYFFLRASSRDPASAWMVLFISSMHVNSDCSVYRV